MTVNLRILFKVNLIYSEDNGNISWEEKKKCPEEFTTTLRLVPELSDGNKKLLIHTVTISP